MNTALDEIKLRCQECNPKFSAMSAVEGDEETSENENIEFVLRKKIHSLQSENYSQKLELSLQRKQIIDLEQKIQQFQSDKREMLAEMHKYDHQIENQKNKNMQFQQYNNFLESKVASLEEKLAALNLTVSQSDEYQKNLDVENQLLIQMKNQLKERNFQLQQNLDIISQDYLILQKDYKGLSQEFVMVEKRCKTLEEIVKEKNIEIDQYGEFMEHKLVEYQESQEKCQKQKQCYREKSKVMQKESELVHMDCGILLKKLEKYKKKAVKYREQRDVMKQEIQMAKKQIGSITLRKYFTDDTE